MIGEGQSKMDASKQRKLRNLLLRPMLQAKIGLYVVALSFVFYLVFSVVVYVGLGRLYHVILELTDLPVEISQIIQTHLSHIGVWLLVIVLVYFALTVLLSVYLTHKMVGPMVAFQRHIRALQAGRYESRIALRKGDAFPEVAEELNKLAQVLESKD